MLKISLMFFINSFIFIYTKIGNFKGKVFNYAGHMIDIAIQKYHILNLPEVSLLSFPQGVYYLFCL